MFTNSKALAIAQTTTFSNKFGSYKLSNKGIVLFKKLIEKNSVDGKIDTDTLNAILADLRNNKPEAFDQV